MTVALDPTDIGPGLRLSIGVSGSGKTYGMRSTVFRNARAFPIIVLDQMAEWHSAPTGIRAVGVSSVREAIDAIKKHEVSLAIVRGPGDVAEMFDRACRWAAKGSGVRGVACSEAHIPIPNGKPLADHVKVAVTQWRHKRLALFLDTQRLALLSRTVTEQATLLKLYAIVGDNDLSVVRATWGKELLESLRVVAARYAAGAPGWHVRLGINRAPPYRVERDR